MRYLRSVVVPGVLVAVACAVVAWAVAGPSAAYSALGGGVAVVVLLGSTPVVLGPVATAMPQFSLAAAMTFYLTKVALLAVALVVLISPQIRDRVDATALGVAAIATTVAWTLLLVLAALRSRQLVYDLRADRS